MSALLDNIHLLICNIMCAQQKVNQFHTTVSEKRCSLYLGSLSLCAFSQKATPSMIQDKKNSGFVLYLFCLTSPNTFTINLTSSPCPLTPL